MTTQLHVRTLRFFFCLVSAGIWIGLAGGCAPRYLAKSPAGVMHYPYVPVTAQELASYQHVISKTPHSPEAGAAHFWIAQDVFNRNELVKAEKQYLDMMKKYPDSEWAPVAGLMASRVRMQMKKNLAAFILLQQVKQTYPQLLAAGQVVQELGRKIINDDLTLDELARVRSSFPNTAWEEQAFFVMGKRNLDIGDPTLAVKLFEQFLVAYPGSEFAGLAQELKDKAAQIVPVNRMRIGCLLPLTGAYAPYGKTLLEGIQLALNQINQNLRPEEQFSLAVADCLGTTEGAIAGFRELAEKEKVIAVIGPALSNSAKVLIPELNQHRLCLITPSAAEPGLTLGSPYMFRYMLTNQEQGEAMAEFVVLRQNLQRIGILNAEDAYDRSLADAFAAKVIQLGGEVVARAEYPRGATDFKAQMLALGGVDPGRIKDADVLDKKTLDNLAETTAIQFHQRLVPAGQVENLDEKALANFPKKSIAVIRLAETLDPLFQESVAKPLTEKLSYALAKKIGLNVSTQNKTFRGLRQNGMSSQDLSREDICRLGNTLQVSYVVMGAIKPQLETPGNSLNAFSTQTYDIGIQLVSVASGEVVASITRTWTRHIPPERNARGIEGVYLPISSRDAILVASQLAFYDLKVKVFGSDAWLTPQLLRQAEAELDGAVFATGFWANDSSPLNTAFVKDFEDQYKAVPTQLAVQAFDTLKLIVAVIKNFNQPNLRRETFREQLAKIHKFKGVTGLAAVEPDNEIRREAVFLEIHQGNLKRVR